MVEPHKFIHMLYIHGYTYKKRTALPSDMKKKHEKPTSDNISHGESIGPQTGWLIP